MIPGPELSSGLGLKSSFKTGLGVRTKVEKGRVQGMDRVSRSGLGIGVIVEFWERDWGRVLGISGSRFRTGVRVGFRNEVGIRFWDRGQVSRLGSSLGMRVAIGFWEMDQNQVSRWGFGVGIEFWN
ncbi:hypothetical protein TIFTF001_013936 [Ficus carica]|uniref:Uncharacterized protein n=1 Tax=Ficus carica TaxID=3494 RepID=A0AA88D6I2_FICCA|nr:hypothetical protein TIFTF001_013936 [Ficus carica]